jgi:HEAT repeat protein
MKSSLRRILPALVLLGAALVPATAAAPPPELPPPAATPARTPAEQAKAAEQIARQIELLRDPDWYEAFENFEVLASFGPPAVDPLIAALKDPCEPVRQPAARALGLIGDKRALQPLVEVLRNEKRPPEPTADSSYGGYVPTPIMIAAAGALGALAGGHADILLPFLTDKAPQVREGIALALGETKDAKAVPSLIGLLKDKDERVRAAATAALGRLEDPRAFEPLVALLWNERRGPTDYGQLAWAMATLRPLVRDATAMALAGTCGENLGPLLATLKDKNPDVREAAAFALRVRKGDEAAAALLAALKEDKVPYVRAAAATALGERSHFYSNSNPWPPAQAVGPLTEALKDPTPEVRLATAETLLLTGEIEMDAATFLSLANDKDPKIRLMALQGLVDLQDDLITQAQLRALKDPDPGVRAQAAGRLGPPRKEEFVEPLVQALKDKEPEVRAAAANGLGGYKGAWILVGSPKNFFPGRRAVDALLTALADEAANVRQAAVESLAVVKEEKVATALIAALKDRESDVRRAAIAALGENGNPRALEPLVAIMNDKKEPEFHKITPRNPYRWERTFYPGTRSAAAEALGQLGDPRAVEPLLAALKDESLTLRISVLAALGTLHDKRGMDAIVATLKDPNERLRLAAVQTLGQMREEAEAAPLLERTLKEDPPPQLRQAAGWALDNLRHKPPEAGNP